MKAKTAEFVVDKIELTNADTIVTLKANTFLGDALKLVGTVQVRLPMEKGVSIQDRREIMEHAYVSMNSKFILTLVQMS